MSIITEMALRRARGRLHSVRSRASAGTPNNPAPPAESADLVVSGPINRLMYLEGRTWAVDLVRSLRGSPVAVVIDRLTKAAVDRPGSYAAGIQSVTTELKEADAKSQLADESLIGQAGRKG